MGNKREDFNDLVNNTYVIRRKLAELTPVDGWYYYFVGDFIVKIFVDSKRGWTRESKDIGSLVIHKTLDEVDLYELTNNKDGTKSQSFIPLERDARFKNYTPIKYKVIPGYSTGKDMPLQCLCELIRYLHKITKLSAFA